MLKSLFLRRSFIVTALILCVAAIIYYCSVIYIPPFKSLGVESLGQVELGMREVDVTLAFGRKSDCSVEEGDSYKTMNYQIGIGSSSIQGQPCRYEIFLRKQNDGMYRVSRICFSNEISRFLPIYTTHMRYEWPRSLWSENYSVPGTENLILETFGEPSFTSVNSDGTGKVLNFNKYNAAFFIIAGSVIQACVSNELPIRLQNEYGDQ